MSAVTDPRDTRVLIPRVRRALEGPLGTGSANAAASSLNDDQVNAVIADAIANVILYTGGLFGHQLQVTERDEMYKAPVAWIIDPELSEDEGSIVVAQSSLDYFYNDLRALKVSETIRDEATEWSYQLSANALVEYLKNLRALRDEALARVTAGGAPVEAYESFIAVRDGYTSSLIEPWISSPAQPFDTSMGVGMGGQELDPRGFF